MPGCLYLLHFRFNRSPFLQATRADIPRGFLKQVSSISINKSIKLASLKAPFASYSMLSGPSAAPASSARPPAWNPVILVLVAIICSIFLVSSYYRVLQRLCCAFNAEIFSRNQAQSRLLDDSNLDNLSTQNQSNALESTVIHSLPITQFKKENIEPPRLSNTDCAVCLGEFEEGEWLKHLPNCTHAFHISCIDTWLQPHSSCPLCRSSVSDLTTRPECSVSMFIMLETLSREDFLQDRAAHYQMLRSEVLRNSELSHEPTGGLQ